MPPDDGGQHHGIVVGFVSRAEDQRDAALKRAFREQVDEIGVCRQFTLVAALKRGSFRRIVGEPPSQAGSGCEILHPLIDREAFLAHASRPQAVDKDTVTVGGGTRLVGASAESPPVNAWHR